ncbi:MAG: hypothetical protein JSR77_16475 [Planctomycetes bacterium]|nr:hypothetical protein [Planctomycetota bacterium]
MPGSELTQLLLLAHAGSTWGMVGLIWFVQIVHYPLMGDVHAEAFPAYERRHQQLTTLVVAPLMLIEAASALTIVFLPSPSTPLRWFGLFLLAAVWASTFFIQVPLHTALSQGFETVVWRRLVVTNWVRTVVWSVRGMLALALLRP